MDEQAERQAFEAAEAKGWKANPKDSVFQRHENGTYVLYSVEERWQGWMMRAAAPVAAQSEIERLTACLAKANAQTEEYERKFYLKSDECEKLLAAPVASQEPIDGNMRLSAEQIFNLATPYFKWNAAGWQEATEGSINMPTLLEFTRAILAAAPVAQQESVEALRDALSDAWSYVKDGGGDTEAIDKLLADTAPPAPGARQPVLRERNKCSNNFDKPHEFTKSGHCFFCAMDKRELNDA